LRLEGETSWSQLVLDILRPRMFPLTLDGLNRGIAALRR
jgi:uncharacterized protein with von Willebrand factor type A (vWA) domain